MPATELQRPPADPSARHLAEIDRLKGELAAKDAKLSEVTAQVAREKATAAIASVVQREAAAIGFVHADLVHKLVDHSLIKVGPSGEITGAREAVERLARDRPALISAPHGGGSPAARDSRRDGRPQQPAGQPAVNIEAELRKHVNYQF